MYEVDTKHLTRQVRRNIERFPKDFMFVLTKEEYNFLRSQFGALKRGKHSKYPPCVFTEHGVAMLSSVLKSKRAVMINIAIIRAFVKIRELLSTNRKIIRKFDEYDKKFILIFSILEKLREKPKKENIRIGFKPARQKERKG